MLQVSIDRLREVLSYNPETGKLTWRVRMSQRVKSGDEAGSLGVDGYVHICVDGRRMRAHRVIFAIMKGYWPKLDVEHEDLDKTNNRWLNLREANDSQNHANTRARGKVGLKGVSQHRGSFQARIKINGRDIYLGTFKTAKAAHAAYVVKAKELFGEFARVA